MSTGVTVSDDVNSAISEFKLSKGGFILFKIGDDKKSIIIDKKVDNTSSYDDFYNAISEVVNECRYALVDIAFETTDNRPTSKIVFVSWIPDTARVRVKMMYAGSKEALRSAMPGIGIHVNASDLSDLDFDSCIMPALLKFS